jgi:polar amino acid transport system substrate-binding protein
LITNRRIGSGCTAAITFAAVLASIVSVRAQTTNSPAAAMPPERELVIGTKEAPPFAMKASDGTWQGISIQLWRRGADESHVSYRFVEEPTVQALLEG